MIHSFLGKEIRQQSGEIRGQYYTRHGSCNMCGKCCTNIYLIHGEDTIDSVAMFEKLKRKNPEYEWFSPVNETEHGLQFQCVHLQPDNSCGIYEDRPTFCKKYPSEKSLLLGGQLAEGCGYTFEIINSFQSVLSQVAEKKRLKAGKLLP